MNDPVENPEHYNQNGIEVIDVIETYAKDDFRLANVIKYVCRCGYKGNRLQDLEKASWYLNRVIDELQEQEDVTAEECWEGIDRGVSDWTLDDIEPMTPEEMEDALRRAADVLLEQGIEAPQHSGGYTPREVEVFFQGYDCREQEEAEGQYVSMGSVDRIKIDTDPDLPEDKAYFCNDTPYHPMENHHEFVSSLATRIAGEDVASTKIKDEYYKFDRYEIQGYCANCDAEISKGQPYIKGSAEDFDSDLKFCKLACVQRLKDWQKDWSAE